MKIDLSSTFPLPTFLRNSEHLCDLHCKVSVKAASESYYVAAGASKYHSIIFRLRGHMAGKLVEKTVEKTGNKPENTKLSRKWLPLRKSVRLKI